MKIIRVVAAVIQRKHNGSKQDSGNKSSTLL